MRRSAAPAAAPHGWHVHRKHVRGAWGGSQDVWLGRVQDAGGSERQAPPGTPGTVYTICMLLGAKLLCGQRSSRAINLCDREMTRTMTGGPIFATDDNRLGAPHGIEEHGEHSSSTQPVLQVLSCGSASGAATAGRSTVAGINQRAHALLLTGAAPDSSMGLGLRHWGTGWPRLRAHSALAACAHSHASDGALLRLALILKIGSRTLSLAGRQGAQVVQLARLCTVSAGARQGS